VEEFDDVAPTDVVDMKENEPPAVASPEEPGYRAQPDEASPFADLDDDVGSELDAALDGIRTDVGDDPMAREREVTTDDTVAEDLDRAFDDLDEALSFLEEPGGAPAEDGDGSEGGPAVPSGEPGDEAPEATADAAPQVGADPELEALAGGGSSASAPGARAGGDADLDGLIGDLQSEELAETAGPITPDEGHEPRADATAIEPGEEGHEGQEGQEGLEGEEELDEDGQKKKGFFKRLFGR